MNRRIRIKLLTCLCIGVVLGSYSAEHRQHKSVNFADERTLVYKNIDYSYFYTPPFVLPEPFAIKSEVEHEIDESAKDMMPRPANYHRSSGILTAVIATATFHYLAGLLLG